MPADQLAQRADELVVADAVHVDLLLVVLQTLEPPEVRVGHGLDEPVAREGLLVGVRRPEALLAVRHLARHARLDGVLRRVLLAELALHRLGRRARVGHGGADGDQRQAVAALLAGGVGPAVRGRQRQRQRESGRRGPLDSVDDVLQGDVSLESF